jgi:signal transduction histidine kinase
MAVSHGLVLALIVSIPGAVGYLLLSASLDRQATNAVRTAAQEEIDHVTDSGGVGALGDSDVPSSSSIQSAVFFPDGRVVGERPAVPTWLRPQPRAVATIVAHGEDVRLATLTVRRGGTTLATVVAGKSMAPEEALLRRVRLLVLLGGLAGVSASMVAGWILSGRAARPVRRAYEAQAAFASDASHEFRTPLAFVQSGVEVLAQGEPHLGGDVLREIGYLTSITERLLALARAQGGRPELELRPVELDEVCREVARRAERALGLSVDLGTDGAAVAMADPVALAAAMDAVMENVARHGGGTATLAATRSPGSVLVSVVDHGPGLPPELRERAFDRFVRGDPARTRGSTGTGAGLGLSLARALVEAQQGRIWLEDTPGSGLTVRIELRPQTP